METPISVGSIVGTLWKYQGNYVTIVEDTGAPLIRVKLDDDPTPFLVPAGDLTMVTLYEFREYVRMSTRRLLAR